MALSTSTVPIMTSYDGQVIENLDLYVDHGDAITVRHDNVIIRNVRIHHSEGNGVLVDGAQHVTVENSEIINIAPPDGQAPETSENICNIQAENSPNLTIRNVTVRDGSAGIYLVDSPGAEISHVDGYNFHGPFPRGQFVQFNRSGDSSLSDFYAFNNPETSHPEDVISAFASPNVTISNGVIDGNNSVSGVGIMFEADSSGGRVTNVDAIHMGNGAFSSYTSDVVFDDTRSFDSIWSDQGRGISLSNGVQWGIAADGISILNSSYTDPGNPGNIAWDRSVAAVFELREDEGATPMSPIINQYDWMM
ncbi:right-handed parallel beta-helix repeat-containing protein [Microvirga arabica]|uniref:Right-handed parallel beta-helix repeat-containing protein n=1 Tax=Microvirga arabica TaxID=1128671 RepID=A0ABV6YCF0_9HYPH